MTREQLKTLVQPIGFSITDLAFYDPSKPSWMLVNGELRRVGQYQHDCRFVRSWVQTFPRDFRFNHAMQALQDRNGVIHEIGRQDFLAYWDTPIFSAISENANLAQLETVLTAKAGESC